MNWPRSLQTMNTSCKWSHRQLGSGAGPTASRDRFSRGVATVVVLQSVSILTQPGITQTHVRNRDTDANDATIDWHQLHLLFRQRLLQKPRNNQQSVPDLLDHDFGQRSLHAGLILDRRTVWATQDPDHRRYWHGHNAVHCRDTWCYRGP